MDGALPLACGAVPNCRSAALCGHGGERASISGAHRLPPSRRATLQSGRLVVLLLVADLHPPARVCEQRGAHVVRVRTRTSVKRGHAHASAGVVAAELALLEGRGEKAAFAVEAVRGLPGAAALGPKLDSVHAAGPANLPRGRQAREAADARAHERGREPAVQAAISGRSGGARVCHSALRRGGGGGVPMLYCARVPR